MLQGLRSIRLSLICRATTLPVPEIRPGAVRQTRRGTGRRKGRQRRSLTDYAHARPQDLFGAMAPRVCWESQAERMEPMPRMARRPELKHIPRLDRPCGQCDPSHMTTAGRMQALRRSAYCQATGRRAQVRRPVEGGGKGMSRSQGRPVAPLRYCRAVELLALTRRSGSIAVCGTFTLREYRVGAGRDADALSLWLACRRSKGPAQKLPDSRQSQHGAEFHMEPTISRMGVDT